MTFLKSLLLALRGSQLVDHLEYSCINFLADQLKNFQSL